MSEKAPASKGGLYNGEKTQEKNPREKPKRKPKRKTAGLAESPCATNGEPRNEDEEKWSLGASEPTLCKRRKRVGHPQVLGVGGVADQERA